MVQCRCPYCSTVYIHDSCQVSLSMVFLKHVQICRACLIETPCPHVSRVTRFKHCSNLTAPYRLGPKLDNAILQVCISVPCMPATICMHHFHCTPMINRISLLAKKCDGSQLLLMHCKACPLSSVVLSTVETCKHMTVQDTGIAMHLLLGLLGNSGKLGILPNSLHHT